MNLIALPAFANHDIWMLHNGRQALVVDPGDARPVRAALQSGGLELSAILVTHHHSEHVGAIAELRDLLRGPVLGPQSEPIPAPLCAAA